MKGKGVEVRVIESINYKVVQLSINQTRLHLEMSGTKNGVSAVVKAN